MNTQDIELDDDDELEFDPDHNPFYNEDWWKDAELGLIEVKK